LSGVTPDQHWLIGVAGRIPVPTFVTMNAKHLQLEGCGRKICEAVRTELNSPSFDLNSWRRANSVASARRVALPCSVCLFYGVLLAKILVLATFLAAKKE